MAPLPKKSTSWDTLKGAQQRPFKSESLDQVGAHSSMQNILQASDAFVNIKIGIANDAGFGVLVRKRGRKEMGRQTRSRESEL